MRSQQLLTALTITSIAGFALFAVTITYIDKPLWIDELHTSWTIHGGFADVIPRGNAGNQAPLYYFILKAVTEFAGSSELVLRSFSVISTIACIALMTGWGVMKKVHPVLLGSVMVMFATDRLVTLFALEARPYAFLMFLTILLFTLQTTRIQHFPARVLKEVMWTLCATAMFYTHYTALPIIVVLFLSRVAFRNDNQIAIKLLMLQFVTIVAFAVGRLDHFTAVFAMRDNWATFIKPERATFEGLVTSFPVIALVMIPCGLLLLDHFLQKHQANTKPEIHVGRSPSDSSIKTLFTWGLLPLLTAWICTRFELVNWFFPRYLITIAPAFYLLFCVAISRLQRPVIKIMGFLIVICTWGVLGHSVKERYLAETVTVKREAWKQIVQYLNAQTGSGNVLLMSGLIEDPQLTSPQVVQSSSVPLQQYCQFPVRGLYNLEQRWNVTALSSTEPSAVTLLPYLKTPRTWAIVRGSRRILQWEQITQTTFDKQQYSRIDFPGNVALFTWRKQNHYDRAQTVR
jgi:mannosyltransferase